MMGKSRSLVVLHKSVPRLVPRRCSHFSGCGQAESTSQASGWRSGLCLPQRSASCGAPFAPGLFHPGKHEPFLQGSLCTVFTSGVWEPPPPRQAKKAQGLRGDGLRSSPSPGCRVRLRESGGPSPQACVVVLHPLVEEKVKEQLEAAKPEPIIEEVVSARVPRGPLGAVSLPHPHAVLPPTSSVSPLLYSLSTHLSPYPFLPPSLSPAFCLCALELGPSSPDRRLLPPQDLANLAPRKPDW